MSGAAEHGRVETIDKTIDIDELMREIERYLAVDRGALRAAGCDGRRAADGRRGGMK